jgi:hypothetical protein
MASTALEHILKRTVRVGNQAQVQVKGPSRSSRCTTTLLEHWVLIVAINKKIQRVLCSWWSQFTLPNLSESGV